MPANEYIDNDLTEVPEGQGAGKLDTDDQALMAANYRGPEFEMVPRAQWRDKINALETVLRGITPKTKNQGRNGSCFLPETRIRLADGSNKRINQLRLLDTVLTAEGNQLPVTQLMVREETERIHTIKLHGHHGLRLTGEHPVLTDVGYVEATDIESGMWVALPRFFAVPIGILQTAHHMSKASNARQYVGRMGKGKQMWTTKTGKETVVTKLPVPDFLELNANTGRIFGLFMAEGTTSRGKVVWTFHKDEEDTLVRDLVELLDCEWGLDAHVQHRANNQCKVGIHGTQWAILFESLCGCGGAHLKRPHADLLSAPTEFLEAMLWGWLDGDGYCRRKRHQGVTVSHDLALSMFDIGNAMGLNPTLRQSYPKVSHGIKERKTRYDLEFGQTDRDADERFYRRDHDYVWRKVDWTASESFTGNVYNFEVAGDHSYVAEGIGVHNCVGHGCVSALEFRGRYQYGMNFTQMSAQSVYCRIGRSASSGAYIPNGIDCMVEDGALPDLTESETWDVTMDSTKWPGRDRLPSGWREVAEEFKVSACRIQGADQFASAAFSGCPVVYGRQGHCIYIFGVTYDRGNYYWMYQNSWGSWGDEVRDGMRGLGYDSERIIRNCTGYAITGVKANKTIALPNLVKG